MARCSFPSPNEKALAGLLTLALHGRSASRKLDCYDSTNDPHDVSSPRIALPKKYPKRDRCLS